MKPLLFITSTLLILTACNNIAPKATDDALKQDSIQKQTGDNSVTHPPSPFPGQFRESSITNCPFPAKNIFGIWAVSDSEPACIFEINEKRLLLCDYDGDGERLYKIVKDSIFLNNPSLVFSGKILQANGDTLVIHWQENETPETLIRWKN